MEPFACCLNGKPCALNYTSWLAGPVEPFACSLNSEHVRAEASGWRTRAGQRLRKPAVASLDYTPALARCAALSA